MVLAARGTRETEAGVVPVEDGAVRQALADRARGIYVRSTILAGVGTALAWALPV